MINSFASLYDQRGASGLFVVLTLISVSGCASAVKWEDSSSSDNGVQHERTREAVPDLHIPNAKLPEYGREGRPGNAVDVGRVETRLRAFYHSWKGVPYQFGGNTRSGIDCSALTQRAMSAAMDVTLERTTRQQIRQGVTVSEDQLASGDLVFFKTGETLNHVGVMLGPSQFLHASTRRGVTLSSLDETYWKTRVIGYRRVRP